MMNTAHTIVGYEKVPRVQRSAIPTAAIVYFHSVDNPYGNYAAMKVELAGSPKDRILTRAYGVPTKANLTQFPLFKDTVHVVSLNFFREVEKQGGARYHLIDPCPGNKMTGRNWFMLWVLVDRLGRKFYYREWPSHGHAEAYIPGYGNLGPWAVPGKAADGAKGPAQDSMGFSLSRYKEEILRLETSNAQRSTSNVQLQKEPEQIIERWMDSRYGNAPTNTKEGATTLIDQMRNELEMDFRSTPGDQIQEGVTLINNSLYYDVTQPVSPTNAPRMYVVETCPNLIYALKEWTGRDGGDGACKDPIDLCRYAEMAELGYVDDQMLKPRQPWMGQFR